MSAGSSQPADRAVGAVPVDHPEGSTSPTPLPSGSAAAGAHRPSEDCSQPADTRIEAIERALCDVFTNSGDDHDANTAALAALAAVAAELAELRQALRKMQENYEAAVIDQTALAELREALPPLVELSHRLLRYTAQIGEGDWTPQDVLGHHLANGVTALSRGATP